MLLVLLTRTFTDIAQTGYIQGQSMLLLDAVQPVLVCDVSELQLQSMKPGVSARRARSVYRWPLVDCQRVLIKIRVVWVESQ